MACGREVAQRLTWGGERDILNAICSQEVADMALIKCPECGKEVSDKAAQCIHCGYPLPVAPAEEIRPEKYNA